MEERRTSLRLSSQKLIPRDISESLGKLPPQALDLEEAILGALMLEVADTPHHQAAHKRISALQPHHFYDDRNQEVFRAIQQVIRDGALPEMRMVVNKLRELGKIELVGGAFYIADLTSKVSSAGNIEYHARVVIEMAMKRRVIEIASQIHHDAYEDDTDIFKMLEQVQQDLQHLEEKETANSGPERIKKLWEQLGIVSKPERPPTLIKLGEADVCTVGNLSLLVGKKKSRKSLLVAYLLWIFLKPRDITANNVVVFDTEQEEYDVWAARDRLFRMTNQHVQFFCLRGLDPKERREFIEMTVRHWPHKLMICVIDGIRDCMTNINDPEESTQVLSWLMKMNVEYKVHIMNVLHLNKTDNNARGHIGTELLNKSEITIEVEIDTKSKDLFPPSVVKCESSRRKPFEPFMFTHGPTDLPEILGQPVGDDPMKYDSQLKVLERVFEGEMLRRQELETEIKAHFGVGLNKAKQLIAQFTTRGWIVKSGKAHSKETSYKMVGQPKITQNPIISDTVIDFNTVNRDEPPNREAPPVDTSNDLPF